jgi:GrpB-like predicted nucleotidyltransferase (UPF0157 family)
MIGPYSNLPVECRPHDPRTADVAARVAALVVERLPSVEVEHVGSTAVSGCWGKGVVDLMLVYPDGQLAAAREVLDGLGLQRQTTPDPFPEERPMRVGTIEHDGTLYSLHVHVLAAGSGEVDEMRWFRDRLRSDPELLRAYVAAKRAIVAAGVTESVAYCIQKSPFVRQVLDERRA